MFNWHIRVCLLATPNSYVKVITLEVTVFEHTDIRKTRVIIERGNSSGSSIVQAFRRVTSSMQACATEKKMYHSKNRSVNKDS